MSPIVAAGLAVVVYVILAVPMWLLLYARGADDARPEATV